MMPTNLRMMILLSLSAMSSCGDDGADFVDGPGTSSGEEGESSGGDSGAECGDGVVEGNEICDDGLNDGSYGSCEIDCLDFGPRCGDGEVQADETCDDGNLADGDGCNHDCFPSATRLWSVDSSDLPFQQATSLETGPEGEVIITGRAILQGRTDSDIWTARFAVDGVQTWGRTYDLAGGTDRGWDVAIGTEGVLWIVGAQTDASGQQRGALLLLDSEGTPQGDYVDASGWALLSEAELDDEGRLHVSGVWEEANAWHLGILDPSSGTTDHQWQQLRGDDLRVSPEGSRFVVHRNEYQQRTSFASYGPDGRVSWAIDVETTELGRALDLTPQGDVVFAFATASEGSIEQHLRAVDTTGEPRWEAEVVPDERWIDVAVGPDGSIAVIAELPLSGVGKIRKFSPEGKPQWSFATSEMWRGVDIASDGDVVVIANMNDEEDQWVRVRRYSG